LFTTGSIGFMCTREGEHPRHSESGHIAHTEERLALIVWGPPLPRSAHSSAARLLAWLVLV